MSGRVAYLNGAFVAEEAAVLPIRDAGVVYGDGVFDTARTFEGRLFRMEEHVTRLFESLAYARIDCGMTPAEVLAASYELVARNEAVRRKGEDYWVTVRVTAGLQSLDGEEKPRAGASVMIDSIPLPLRARANYFRDGVPAVVPARRRIAPDALSPNAKTNNYINMMIAQREVSAVAPGAWALMCDPLGDLAEGPGSNLFIVKDGVVITPPRTYILAGVSRAVVIELCGELGLEVREVPVSVHAGMAADEAFFTSTSLCAVPVSALNGHVLPGGVPGPVTKRIMEAFAAHVGMDYVAQYLQFAGDAEVSAGL